MSNNKTARRDYIDIMKGLGILLVVLGHFMEQFRFGFKPIGATFICIYLFHMASISPPKAAVRANESPARILASSAAESAGLAA